MSTQQIRISKVPSEMVPPGCATGDSPCKLSVGLDEAKVIEPFLAPSGEHVVFLHQPEVGPFEIEIYSAPVAGGPPVRLTPSGEGSAGFVAISPDSTRVLYTLPAADDLQRRELFSIPIAGPASARVKLAADISTTTQVQVSPDSRKVVFAPAPGDRLRVVPLEGPANAGARLTAAFVTGGRVGDVRISANSKSVVYGADQDTDGVVELYRVPLTLSPAPDPPTTKLNGPVTAPGVGEFALAPDDNGPVVYQAREGTADARELYRVQVGGGGRAKLSHTLPSGWEVRAGSDGHAFYIVPDGSRAIYRITRSPDASGRVFGELYSVPTAGPASASVRLDHPPLIPPGEIFATLPRISADSSRVVYLLIDQNLPPEPDLSSYWLISVPAAGPASVGRALTFPATGEPSVALSPDSERVVYSLPGTSTGNVFSVPIDGGTSERLNGDETTGGAVVAGNRALYRAKLPGVNESGLFSAPVDGNGTRFNLTESLDDVWAIYDQHPTPDATRVVYTLSRGPLDAPVELFSSGVVPGAAATP
jgi:hypothetical protein